MIRVAVLYPHTPGARFDWDYYLNQHCPMVKSRFGAALVNIEVDRGLNGLMPGSPPAYTAICYLTFDSVEAFQAALQEHSTAIRGDIPNYTDIPFQLQISEVAH